MKGVVSFRFQISWVSRAAWCFFMSLGRVDGVWGSVLCVSEQWYGP